MGITLVPPPQEEDLEDSMEKHLDAKTFEHFIDCKRCGYSFSPKEFDTHNCDEMSKPAHNHIDGECSVDCPVGKRN